jgi:RNA polymerase sigma-70 factor (ECF subfamily)
LDVPDANALWDCKAIGRVLVQASKDRGGLSLQLDEVAFGQVVRSSTPRIYRLCYRLTGQHTDAEDVLQDVFARAYERLQAGQFLGHAALETWLYRMAANAAVDLLRSRQRWRRLFARWSSRSEADLSNAETRVELRELAAALEEMPAEQRAALVLTQVDGHSNSQAAKLLGCSEGAIEQRLIRARATLRKRRF